MTGRRDILSDCQRKDREVTILNVSGKVFNRALLNRMKDEVDIKFRDQQAGFRRDRSCVDQIATLRIIIEQSCEWNSPLYINFVEFQKAFHSLNRDTIWKLLRHYGVPVKIVNIISSSYDIEARQSQTSSNTVMAYYDPSLDTEVAVDGSPVGLGAILTQKSPGATSSVDVHIISYASRALTDVEKRYSQTDKEALAIVGSCVL